MNDTTDMTGHDNEKERDSAHDEASGLAREQVGKVPNRDKDEFTKGHLKEPEVDIETEEAINEEADQG